jgi:hypothetical protein
MLFLSFAGREGVSPRARDTEAAVFKRVESLRSR